MFKLKKQINKLFLICLLGILFSFTHDILTAINKDKENFSIELTEEQDEEESKSSEENREGKEKSEIEIDDFLSNEINFSICLFYTTLNKRGQSIGILTNKIYDLSTPPPKLS